MYVVVKHKNNGIPNVDQIPFILLVALLLHRHRQCTTVEYLLQLWVAIICYLDAGVVYYSGMVEHIESPWGENHKDAENTANNNIIFDREVPILRMWKGKNKGDVLTKRVTISEDDVEKIGLIHRDMIREHEWWKPSTLDVIEMFHDGEEVNQDMVKMLNRIVKENKKSLARLNALDEKIRKEVYSTRGLTPTQKATRFESMKIVYTQWKRKPIEDNIKRLELLQRFVRRGKGTRFADGLDFQKAKQYPIPQLIKFQRNGFIKCIWPEHNEKTASMKYYPKDNHVYCHGCHKGGDAIDVVQAIRGCTVQEAVRYLTRM